MKLELSAAEIEAFAYWFENRYAANYADKDKWQKGISVAVKIAALRSER